MTDTQVKELVIDIGDQSDQEFGLVRLGTFWFNAHSALSQFPCFVAPHSRIVVKRLYC
jgi:hypothetical protein